MNGQTEEQKIKSEYNKLMYKLNKTYISEYNKNNKERLQEYRKQRYINNREEIKQNYNETKFYIMCECGKKYINKNKARHILTKIHIKSIEELKI
jgi:hypothetical protein